MQPIEIALFGAVVALAAGLIGYIAVASSGRGGRAAGRRKRARSRRRAPGGPGLVCPACQREYEAGLQFCPHDARELVPATDPAARAAVPGMTCPNCRRSFDAIKRFCPFDGEELVPLTLAVAAAATPSPPCVRHGRRSPAAGYRGRGQCRDDGEDLPHCSRRYESDATFCGRDGSELVSVN